MSFSWTRLNNSKTSPYNSECLLKWCSSTPHHSSLVVNMKVWRGSGYLGTRAFWNMVMPLSCKFRSSRKPLVCVCLMLEHGISCQCPGGSASTVVYQKALWELGFVNFETAATLFPKPLENGCASSIEVDLKSGSGIMSKSFSRYPSYGKYGNVPHECFGNVLCDRTCTKLMCLFRVDRSSPCFTELFSILYIRT